MTTLSHARRASGQTLILLLGLLAMLALITMVPEISLWLPRLMKQGTAALARSGEPRVRRPDPRGATSPGDGA